MTLLGTVITKLVVLLFTALLLFVGAITVITIASMTYGSIVEAVKKK